MTGAVTSVVFVGRASEVRLLRGLVTDLVAGRGRAAWVEGEPGIGKSALLVAGLAEARQLGCEVLWAAADELGQRFPLQVILDCLEIDARSSDPRRADLARLLRAEVPGVGSVAGAAAGDPVVATVERVLALVDVLCSASPLVLVVDDLQWADEASLLVWHRLARAVQQLPLLLVGACRPVPRREELERVRRGLRAPDGVVVPLGPLSPSEVSELVSGLVGAPAGPGLRRRAEQAAGNPLYLREVVDALLREEALRVEAGVAEVVGRPVGAWAPTSLGAAIADRLGFLSRDSREVLRTAALLGAEFSVPDLGVVVGRAASELVPVVDEAVAAGVVEASGSLLRFRHGLIREALYEGMPAAVRSALHRQAAQALAEAGAPAERVAQQLLPVVETHDAWMLGWLTEAAPALIYRAPQTAAELLERALEHSPVGDPRRERLEMPLGTALLLLARHDEVERLAQEVLARTDDPPRAAEMTWMLAYTLLRTGRPAEARTATGATRAGAPLPPPWQARLCALHAVSLVFCGQLAEAEDAARQALAEGEDAGDRLAVGYALHALSLHQTYGGDYASLLGTVDRALAALGDDPETLDVRLLLLHNRAAALEQLDRLAEAESAIGEARSLAERTGTPRLGMIQVGAAQLYFQLGRWDDAQTELESVTDLPDTQWDVLVLHGLSALIACHRDDRRAVEAELHALDDRDIAVGAAGIRSYYLLVARALAAERDRAPERALDILARTLRPKYARYVVELRHRCLPDVVRLALDAGDEATARAATEAAEADAAQLPTPCRAAAATRCRGLLDADPAAVLAAADRYRAVGRPLELAQGLEDAAVLLARRGRTEPARAALAEAVGIYTELGADWDITRADARVRPLGIRRGPRGRRRRATTGWDALSPTEVKVARRVAQGRSNPQIGAELFLSRRTVQTHVSHIMVKLGVHSRSEVARETALHPATGGDEHAAGRVSPA